MGMSARAFALTTVCVVLLSTDASWLATGPDQLRDLRHPQPPGQTDDAPIGFLNDAYPAVHAAGEGKTGSMSEKCRKMRKT